MRKALVLSAFLATLAACASSDAPVAPPEWSPPPEVSTEDVLTAYTEADIAMSVPELRAFMQAEPLISFLRPTETISNPVGTEVLRGRWPEPGATRRVELADGHYVIERVVENTPASFTYQIYVFTNATGRGVEQIVGVQRFVATDAGTRFEWSYHVKPRNFITRQIVQRRMDEIEDYISGGLTRFAAAANAQGG